MYRNFMIFFQTVRIGSHFQESRKKQFPLSNQIIILFTLLLLKQDWYDVKSLSSSFTKMIKIQLGIREKSIFAQWVGPNELKTEPLLNDRGDIDTGLEGNEETRSILN